MAAEFTFKLLSVVFVVFVAFPYKLAVHAFPAPTIKSVK